MAGAIHIGDYIYVIAGQQNAKNMLSSIERLNVFYLNQRGLQGLELKWNMIVPEFGTPSF